MIRPRLRLTFRCANRHTDRLGCNTHNAILISKVLSKVPTKAMFSPQPGFPRNVIP
jgi:hypothetical protein